MRYYYDEICTHYCTVWISSHVMTPVYKSLFSYTMKGEGIYLYVGTDAAVFAYLPAQPAENKQVVMAYPLAHVRDLAVSQGYLWVASEQELIIFEDLPCRKAFLPIQLR